MIRQIDRIVEHQESGIRCEQEPFGNPRPRFRIRRPVSHLPDPLPVEPVRAEFECAVAANRPDLLRLRILVKDVAVDEDRPRPRQPSERLVGDGIGHVDEHIIVDADVLRMVFHFYRIVEQLLEPVAVNLGILRAIHAEAGEAVKRIFNDGIAQVPPLPGIQEDPGFMTFGVVADMLRQPLPFGIPRGVLRVRFPFSDQFLCFSPEILQLIQAVFHKHIVGAAPRNRPAAAAEDAVPHHDPAGTDRDHGGGARRLKRDPVDDQSGAVARFHEKIGILRLISGTPVETARPAAGSDAHNVFIRIAGAVFPADMEPDIQFFAFSIVVMAVKRQRHPGFAGRHHFPQAFQGVAGGQVDSVIQHPDRTLRQRDAVNSRLLVFELPLHLPLADFPHGSRYDDLAGRGRIALNRQGNFRSPSP